MFGQDAPIIVLFLLSAAAAILVVQNRVVHGSGAIFHFMLFLIDWRGAGLYLSLGCADRAVFTDIVNVVAADMLTNLLNAAGVSAKRAGIIPGAPLFAFTLLKALLRLSLYSFFSKSSGCALSLSFHIERNDLRTSAYLLCSALFLCGQSLSSEFSAFISRPSFPSHT